MDFYFPTLLEPASSRLEILSNAGRFQSPTSGFTRTISRPGERMRLTLSFENTNGAMRAALQSYLAGMRGAVHRVHAHDHSNRIRGSFPATELLSNPTFANGTTGYSTGSFTLSVADRELRALRIENVGSVTSLARLSSALAVTQYAPHVLRVMTAAGRGTFVDLSLRAGNTDNGTQYGQSALTLTPGLLTFAFTPYDTVCRAGLYQQNNTTSIAGDYLKSQLFSIARCALVDNGLNAMTRSDELDHADWTKTRCSITANGQVAPDGTTTADAVIEDTTVTNTHTIGPATAPTRTSQAEDLLVYGFFKRGAGTRDIQMRVGSDASNHGSVVFNLSTGATSGTTNTGTATNTRGFSVNMGNGWYLCFVVARVAASTTLYSLYSLVNAGSNTYTGDGTSSVYGWRLGCGRSSVPCRPVQTVASALPSGTGQTGSAIYSKGWPVSTNGLLLPGDQVQIGNQLLIVTEALNSDAAGLGFLQFAPALRSAASDNAPVIVNQPMGKFFLESDANGWGNKPGIFSDAEVVLAEAA